MTGIPTDLIVRIAKAKAKAYKRRVWWASKDDMEQAGALAAVEAARTFNPAVGIPFEGYAGVAASKAIHVLVLKDSAPVSAGWHHLDDLKGLQREEEGECLGMPDTSPDPLQALMREEYDHRMHAALAEILENDKDAEIAKLVLLRDLKPRSVAQMTGVPVTRIYEVVKRVKAKVGKNWACWLLWNEQE